MLKEYALFFKNTKFTEYGESLKKIPFIGSVVYNLPIVQPNGNSTRTF